MRPPDLVDSQGKPIPLGALLGRGGEGAVYEVSQTTVTVAKVYHKPLSKDRTDKIKAMTMMRTDSLSKLTSWPIDLIRMRATGQPIGLLMPRIANRKNIHHLYGPKSRLQDFPKADWRFLVRAAANIARAFSVVHDTGCVVGDVNHGSIMVAEDATVSLIDCDSFQVNAQGRHFPCEVGIETFTPPELQGMSYRGVLRTPNYDNFGLAVMIFHLLFMGRHPFAGRFSGAGDMPIARAIKECRFPYSANHKAMQMDPPPGTPPLSFVGAEVAHLFETAFSQTTIKDKRPTARTWVAAMQALEKNTKRCGVNLGHWHPSHLSECPWCRMEARGANPLFPFVVPLTPGAFGPTVDLEALWQQINGLPILGPAPTISFPEVSPSAAAQKLGKPGIFAFVVGVLTGRADEVDRFRKAMSDADANFNRVEADWRSRAGEGAFDDAKRKFIDLKNEVSQIPVKRNRALDQLKQSQRKLQLDRFLDKFELENARIEGIGPGRKRTLESYGIETAEDIAPHRINAVPGFGPKMVERLMKWRRSIEAKFVFDPAKTIDPQDIAKVEQDILALRTKAETEAKAAHVAAMQAHARITAIRQTMRPQLNALRATLAQAQEDYQYVSR